MSVKSRKKNKQRQYKSNLRRINIVVTAQTDYHLEQLCHLRLGCKGQRQGGGQACHRPSGRNGR